MTSDGGLGVGYSSSICSGLVGRVCVVSEAIRGGRGLVRVLDEEFRAVASGDVEVGDCVYVASAEGGCLRVRPLDLGFMG